MNHNITSIIAAAALMTFQAALLAVLAASEAGAASAAGATETPGVTAPRPVYRCMGNEASGPARGTRVVYQHHPCPHASHSQRLRMPVAAAQASPPPVTERDQRKAVQKKKAKPPRTRKGRQGKQRKASMAQQATAASALTRHRVGERPFEHMGHSVEPSAKPQSVRKKRKRRSPAHGGEAFVARVPRSPGRQGP